MVDLDRLNVRLRALEENAKLLDEILATDRTQFVTNTHLQLEFERLLQVSIQGCIDIAAHVVASEGFENPADYADVFEILGNREVIDRELAGRLAKATGTRNLLVHGYLAIDRGRLFEEASTADLREFSRVILTYACN